VNIFIFKNSSNHFYNKQDGCLVLENFHFFKPDFVTNLSYTAALAIKITKSGKYIKPEFVSRYYSFYGTAINLYLTDYIKEANEEYLSFFKSSLFDRSTFLKKNENNQIVEQIGNKILISKEFSNKIFELSKFATLKSGDLILFEISEHIEFNNQSSKIGYSADSLEFPEVIID
jgi:2-keto-4-pentenoate hydratase/2-oxohepta-3-ene-1,7-dioic acid hydratase in catechol pathway